MQEAKIIFYPEYSKQVSLKCEIAKSLSAKMKGLMHRESLPNDEGMLFLFMFSGHRFFWMKNVKIPLDIVYIDKEGTIVDLITAEPCESKDCDIYYPIKKALFVLEVNHGYFSEMDMGSCYALIITIYEGENTMRMNFGGTEEEIVIFFGIFYFELHLAFRF